MHSLVRSALAILVLFICTQCSVGFNQAWDRARTAEAGKPPADITGPWVGTWRSEANGHSGELKCVVTRINPQTGECQFRYHAVFMGTLSAGYEVTHIVKAKGKQFTFSGDQHLSGLGGGLYHYEGHATPTTFHATYRSSFDHGIFEMGRP